MSGVWILFRPFMIAIALLVMVDTVVTYTPIHQFLDDRVQNLLERKWVDSEKSTTQPPKPVDILFIGTSRTNNGFATPTFQKQFPSLRAYNMGLPTGDYSVFTLVLNQWVKEYGKPKLVLLEVAPFLFKEEPMADHNLLYYRDLLGRNPALWSQVMDSPQLSWHDKRELALSYVSGLYRYRSVIGARAIFKLVKHALNGRFSTTTLYQGWKPMAAVNEVSSPQQFQEKGRDIARKHLAGFHQLQTHRIEGFLTYCQNAKIPVALVQWPTHQAYGRWIEGTPMYQTYINYLHQLIQSENILLIDLNQPEKLKTRDRFGESSHLNQKGAMFYTQYLGKHLLKTSLFSTLFPS